ncbi:hypothetical protein KFE25_002318 [Diacronema lutheri]|uniref:Uncharacterized protein n=1 Tax=Diacronema lutheri TaxID=2081491 RepID=A0A8J5X7Z0_DIALT|nr:hypothetical protein KFE25_002318 [Diacronema lutheri]
MKVCGEDDEEEAALLSARLAPLVSGARLRALVCATPLATVELDLTADTTDGSLAGLGERLPALRQLR